MKQRKNMSGGTHRKGIYEKYIKRPQDFLCALMALLVLWTIMGVTAALVRIKLGSPIFAQERPGLNGKLYKFRTMIDEWDEKGNLLPDEVRLARFGKILRATSLEGNDIIRQTTKSLENKRFREVSPIHFYQGCNLHFQQSNYDGCIAVITDFWLK